MAWINYNVLKYWNNNHHSPVKWAYKLKLSITTLEKPREISLSPGKRVTEFVTLRKNVTPQNSVNF